MALDTKAHIQASITARQAAFPSGVFLDGVERPGTVTRTGMVNEMCDLCDAILALTTGGADITAAVAGGRAFITALRNSQVSDSSIITAQGVVPPNGVLARGAALEGLVIMIGGAAHIVDGAYGATAAAALADELMDSTSGQHGSGVFVDGAELPGATSLHEFRPAYLVVLAAVAAALP